MLNVQEPRDSKAILPVSAASPLGAVFSGKKVHGLDQETCSSPLPKTVSCLSIRFDPRRGEVRLAPATVKQTPVSGKATLVLLATKENCWACDARVDSPQR